MQFLILLIKDGKVDPDYKLLLMLATKLVNISMPYLLLDNCWHNITYYNPLNNL